MDAEEFDLRAHHFADEVGILYESFGLPRMAGRVIGWLLICDPSHQSSSQLADALYASKGSMSTNTRLLMQMGLVEKVPVRGERGSFFRIGPGAWDRIMDRELSSMVLLREITDAGLKLVDGHPPERRQRLEEVNDLCRFLELELPALMERWRVSRRSKS